jgi:dolichol-phosphate mannosyltransferase
MSKNSKKELSIVVPVYNEQDSINEFNENLNKILSSLSYDYKIIYVNDGSTDKSLELLSSLASDKIKILCLSRNFGKEIALTAGINHAKGDAIICLDADGQHPPKYIADFITKWEQGSDIVIGVRSNNQFRSKIASIKSKIFYWLFNYLSNDKLIEGSTDFRLIDRSVADEFMTLNEPDRMTRLLIDWLGFDRDYIYFEAEERTHGYATYSNKKLLNLAFSAMISSSPKPLYLFAYLGIFISSLSFLLGFSVLIEQILLGDPLKWFFTGTAMLGILIIFLVGIVLMSQGIISMYISKINNQTKGRPIYVVNRRKSIGFASEEIY